MAPSRRILITGLATVWGGRLAQMLEHDPDVETIVGIDTGDPRHALERTEFVRTETDAGPVARIIRAAGIDTIVDTRLVADTTTDGSRGAPRVNLASLRQLLSAAGTSGVSKLVVKASAECYGAGRDAPAFFTEDMPLPARPESPDQGRLAAAERLLEHFAREHSPVTVTVLRCALPVGSELRTPYLALLGLPKVPAILGFDPRWQFVHEDDVLGGLAHAVTHEVRGPCNLAGDGVLALSEVAGLLGKSVLPILPPWGTLLAGAQVRRLRIPVPVGLLRDLRYGRGLDNRRLKASGYMLRYTSREAVLKLRAQQRLQSVLGPGGDSYRYEREVEDFLRFSPSVRSRRVPPAVGAEGYSALTQNELLAIIPSLETEAMMRLREHEQAGPGRSAVLGEIDHQLELRRGPGDE